MDSKNPPNGYVYDKKLSMNDLKEPTRVPKGSNGSTYAKSYHKASDSIESHPIRDIQVAGVSVVTDQDSRRL